MLSRLVYKLYHLPRQVWRDLPPQPSLREYIRKESHAFFAVVLFWLHLPKTRHREKKDLKGLSHEIDFKNVTKL